MNSLGLEIDSNQGIMESVIPRFPSLLLNLSIGTSLKLFSLTSYGDQEVALALIWSTIFYLTGWRLAVAELMKSSISTINLI